jgi:hypothetical protein
VAFRCVCVRARHDFFRWSLWSVCQVSARMADDGADVEALMARMERLQAAIDAVNGWELDRQLERATDALRCPPGWTTEQSWQKNGFRV